MEEVKTVTILLRLIMQEELIDGTKSNRNYKKRY